MEKSGALMRPHGSRILKLDLGTSLVIANIDKCSTRLWALPRPSKDCAL